jgi:hypothetical protein
VIEEGKSAAFQVTVFDPSSQTAAPKLEVYFRDIQGSTESPSNDGSVFIEVDSKNAKLVSGQWVYSLVFDSSKQKPLASQKKFNASNSSFVDDVKATSLKTQFYLSSTNTSGATSPEKSATVRIKYLPKSPVSLENAETNIKQGVKSSSVFSIMSSDEYKRGKVIVLEEQVNSVLSTWPGSAKMSCLQNAATTHTIKCTITWLLACDKTADAKYELKIPAQVLLGDLKAESEIVRTFNIIENASQSSACKPKAATQPKNANTKTNGAKK